VAPRDDRPCGEQLHAGDRGNRIGVEGAQTFYGHSFISDEWGDLLGDYGARMSAC
jgi:predicted amidohydrolase